MTFALSSHGSQSRAAPPPPPIADRDSRSSRCAVISVATPGPGGLITARRSTSRAPATGSPAITQKHVFVGAGYVDSLATLGAPALRPGAQIHCGVHAQSRPVFGAGILGQKHVLTASPLVVVPLISVATLGQAGILTALPIVVVVPPIGTGTFTQLHALAPAIAIAVTNPAIGQGIYGRNITAVPLIVVSPTIGAPVLSKVLTAANLAAPVPVLGVPPLGKLLSAANLATGPPTVEAETLGQGHILGADALAVSAPSHSAVVMGQAGTLAAMPIAVVAPTISVGIFVQQHRADRDRAAGHEPDDRPGHLRPEYSGDIARRSGADYRRVVTHQIANRRQLLDDGADDRNATAHQASRTDQCGMPAPRRSPPESSARDIISPPSAVAVIAPSHSAAVLSQAGVMAAMPLVAGAPVFGTVILVQRQTLPRQLSASGLPVAGTGAFTQRHALAAANLVLPYLRPAPGFSDRSTSSLARRLSQGRPRSAPLC